MIDIDKKVDYVELVKNIEEVYSYFTDDLSKELFKLRWQRIFDKQLINEFAEFAPNLNDMEKYLEYKKTYENLVNEMTKDIQTIILYGAGLDGKLVLFELREYIKNSNIKVLFCDKDYKTKKNYLGYEVISPEELVEHYNNCNVLICSRIYEEEIKADLISLGFKEDYLHIPTLTRFINEEAQYFDLDIIKLGENEVFVDAGVLSGGTTLEFLKRCNNKYKKIYLFEPGDKAYDMSKKNMDNHNVENYELHKVGLWDKKDTLTFYDNSCGASFVIDSKRTNVTENYKEIKIEVNSLDNVLKGEEVTFIKMDIEGSELNALKGAKETILKYKPKLAISIYHKPEDIIELPAYIKSLVPEYKLYLRHYSNIQTETVLFAVIED